MSITFGTEEGVSGMRPFLDNFRPDPEMPDSRWVWRTAKPLLRDAVVTCAPYYPEYPRLKVGTSGGPSDDPSCPSARAVGTDIDVVIYSDSGTSGGRQERAWDFILGHYQLVEASLRRKLFARHSKFLKQFVDEDLPEAKHLQTYWDTIKHRVRWDDPSAVNHLFKLVSVGLAESGLDECGFSSFEFQTGWDRDHGLGVLMHKDRVLAADGMTELIVGNPDSIAAGAKHVQGYDLDDGDYLL
ncbi:hypothetical protein J0H58_14980 [bacterium]|nr:hypothetical protein [bacterium]